MVTENRKINVLELNSGFGYAGGARNLYSFCRRLNKDVFNIFAGSYASGGPGEQVLNELGIEFIIGNNQADKVLDFIKLKNIDLIHIHRSGIYVPIEDEILSRAKQWRPDLVIVEKNVFGNYDERVDKYIDCSNFQSMMHLNERYLPKSGRSFDFNRLKVLYNMVDAEEFQHYRLTATEITDRRRALGLAADDFVIGKIARAHIAKWSDLVLEMMPYAIKLIPKLKFIIIGLPASRRHIIEQKKLKDHFIILEETADEALVHAFYQTIDVLVHSSKIGECNGNTINEAMYWEKPVIVNSTPSRDNGQLEQVNHMVDGLVANHPQTFARAVEYLYKNQEAGKRLALKAKEKILQVNSPINIVGQTEKLFIEKLILTGVIFNQEVIDKVNQVVYQPSQEEIVDYKKTYQSRLKWDFGQLSLIEQLVNLSRQPNKFFYKVKDFLEGRGY